MIRRFAIVAVVAVGLVGCSSSGSTSSSSGSKSSKACYVGNWVGTDATMQTMLGVKDEPNATLTGAVALTLNQDGSFAYAFDELGTNTSSEGQPAQITLNGSVSGTYTATGDALAFNLEKNDVTVTVNGKSQKGDIKLGSNDKGNGTVGETPYTCGGNNLSLTGSNDGKVTTWTRD